jgi:dipeptidyl aminopeptidase/acylaminoacyl peptidase
LPATGLDPQFASKIKTPFAKIKRESFEFFASKNNAVTMEYYDLISSKASQSVEIPTSRGVLASAIHLPKKLPAPVVVCCHGMLSSKDGPKYTAMGEYLSRDGLAVLRFDFSGCGASKAEVLGSLLASRTSDLIAAIDYVKSQQWANGQIGLLGSSLGGYLALLAAAEDERIQAIVCWATPFDLKRVRASLEQSQLGHAQLPPGLKLGSPENLQSLPAISRVLIIHGQLDELVRWEESLILYGKLSDPKRLLLFERAEHRFLDPTYRQLAMRASLDWFQKYLMP